GEDEAVAVAADGVAQPLGARQRAQEEEEERVRQELAAPQRNGGQPAVLAVQRSDLAPVANDHAVPLELADEAVGHRLAEGGAAGRRGGGGGGWRGAPRRASKPAACPGEWPPPTPATREPAQSCASGAPAA